MSGTGSGRPLMSCRDRCLRGKPTTHQRKDRWHHLHTDHGRPNQTRPHTADRCVEDPRYRQLPTTTTSKHSAGDHHRDSIARLQARVQTLQQELQLLKSQGHDVIPQRTVHGDTLATSQRATPGSTAQAGGGKGACMCAWRPMAASVFAWSDRDVMCLGVVRASPEGEEAVAAAAAPPPLTAVDDDDVVSTALSQVPEHTHTSQMQEGCRPSLLWWLWWATSVPRFHDAHTAQPAAQRQ